MKVLLIDGLLFIKDPMSDDVEFNQIIIKKVTDIIKEEKNEVYILFPFNDFEVVEGYLKEKFISLGVTNLSKIKFYSTYVKRVKFENLMELTFLRFLMNEWDKVEYYSCIGRIDIEYVVVPNNRIRVLDTTD